MLGKLLPFLANINKAWVSGVITALATLVLGQFFHIQIDGATIDLVTNIAWAFIGGGAVGTATFLVPNVPLPETVVTVPIPSIGATQKATLFGPIDYNPVVLPDTYDDPVENFPPTAAELSRPASDAPATLVTEVPQPDEPDVPKAQG